MKKYIKYFLLIIVVVPFLILILQNMNILLNDQWIGFLGSYLGAIIGGVISGSITLFVMKETISENKKELENTFTENKKQEEIRNNKEYCFKLIKEIGKFKNIICQYQFLLDRYIEENCNIECYNELVFIYANFLEISFELTSILYLKEIHDDQVYELDEYKIEIEKIIKDTSLMLYEYNIKPSKFKKKNRSQIEEINTRLAMIENLALKIADRYYKNDTK